MRVTTAFNRLLQLDGVNVTAVVIGADTVTVDVRLRRRKLTCPVCDFSTWSRYDTRPVSSSWRHLRLGTLKLVVRTQLRRLTCPDHGVRVEGVPFARHGCRFTRDFEQLVAWLATKMDQDALRRLVGIDWDTVGRICGRVVADELDPHRLDDLFDIGVDEVSWRKHHNYLTLVVNHTTNKVVWGAEGRDSKTLDGLFDELGGARSSQIRAVSMDMGPAYRKSVTADGHAPQATICIDPFHAVKNITDALNTVRRDLWQQLRELPDPDIARKFKGARWALLKNPDDLTDRQAHTLAAIKRHGGAVWRAYRLKEAFRAIFAGDLDERDAGDQDRSGVLMVPNWMGPGEAAKHDVAQPRHLCRAVGQRALHADLDAGPAVRVVARRDHHALDLLVLAVRLQCRRREDAEPPEQRGVATAGG